MGSLSIWHWMIVLGIVVLVFGTARLPSLGGDVAKAIKAFKRGMNDDPEPVAKKEEITKNS